MPSETPEPIDLEKTLRMMDVADEIRRRRRRVEEHLEARITVPEEGELSLVEYIELVAEHELSHGGDLVPASRARRWRARHADTT